MPRDEPSVGRYLIYGLVDPRNRCLRYVGKTHKRREIRLAEHILRASLGRRAPVYEWIRSLQAEGLAPEIFVLERVPATASWRMAEREAISRWQQWPESELPYAHPPQTPKSQAVEIKSVSILNVQAGG